MKNKPLTEVPGVIAAKGSNYVAAWLIGKAGESFFMEAMEKLDAVNKALLPLFMEGEAWPRKYSVRCEPVEDNTAEQFISRVDVHIEFAKMDIKTVSENVSRIIPARKDSRRVEVKTDMRTYAENGTGNVFVEDSIACSEADAIAFILPRDAGFVSEDVDTDLVLIKRTELLDLADREKHLAISTKRGWIVPSETMIGAAPLTAEYRAGIYRFKDAGRAVKRPA